MQTISSQLDPIFRSAIRAAFNVDADPLLSPSQNDKFGDYQSNAAMGLAKVVAEKTGQKTNPRQIAEQIKSHLQLGDIATEISIAGPGFINVRLNPAWLAAQLAQLLPDPRLGITPVPIPQSVVVDYSGPNIAKELHVGHLRSTIIGDALVRLLAFQGHHVIRQNHLGDWGTQFGMLITHLLDTAAGSSKVDIKDLNAFYVDAKKRFDAEESFQSRARDNVVKLQSGDPAILAAWKQLVETTREHYLPIYQRLGILLTPADERGESFYNPMLPAVVADLKNAGIAEDSEGAVVVFTDGKDKAPLIIQKSGTGGYLYGTTDLAALRHRVDQLHANRIIYVTGAPQSQHFAQVFATARRAGWVPANVSLEHASFGSVLGEDNKMFKSRSGGTVKLKDLLDEAEERARKIIDEKNPSLPDTQRQEIAHAIGVGAMKYADLSKDRVSDYVFSFDKMLSFDGNTAPYLQNAYVRIKSIFRKANLPPGTVPGGSAAAIQLSSPQESALAKQVLRFGEVIESVARDLKPHLLTSYLYDLATLFHSFYEHCPVLSSEEPTRSSRLALSHLTARTLAQGLDLLGIQHPEQM